MKNKTMLEQIIEHCSKNGITSYELAKHLPLSQVALHGILSGTTTQPRIKNVQLIYEYLFGNDYKTTESEKIFETSFDKKIAENEEKIQKKKLEIKDWENKINLHPEKKETYNKYIDGLHEQIFLLNDMINITLVAKKEFLEESHNL